MLPPPYRNSQTSYWQEQNIYSIVEENDMCYVICNIKAILILFLLSTGALHIVSMSCHKGKPLL